MQVTPQTGALTRGLAYRVRALLAASAFLALSTAAAVPELEGIVEAHGGADRLSGLDSYAARHGVTDIWAHQSPRPGPPWETSSGLRCHVYTLDGRRFAGFENRMAAGYYPIHSASWLTPGGGWRYNLYDGWRARADAGRAGAAVHAASRFAPTVLVAALARDRDHVTYLGRDDGEDAPRLRFRFAPDGRGALELAFDARTRMLRALESGDVMIRYDGFETVSGLPVSRRMTMSWRGDTVRRLHLDQAAFDVEFPVPPGTLAELPDATPETSADPRRFRTQTLAPGVYFIGGGATYQIFVEFRDFVVALGAVGGVEKRLAALRDIVGTKPLRYALVSHHHADHLEGVPALVDAGAVLVVAPAHEDLVRRAAGGNRQPRFAHVTGERRITDGERFLVFTDLGPMRHSEHMLAAWLPGEKILFSADLFVQPPSRPVRAANPPIRDLYRVVTERELDVTRFVDTHSPVVGNLADLRLAASREPDSRETGDTMAAVCPP